MPAGTYKVLAAFNDFLVRDPDLSIGGTSLQELTVTAGQNTSPESFRITGALAVVSPGRDGPEAVDGMPVFVFENDSRTATSFASSMCSS